MNLEMPGEKFFHPQFEDPCDWHFTQYSQGFAVRFHRALSRVEIVENQFHSAVPRGALKSMHIAASITKYSILLSQVTGVKYDCSAEWWRRVWQEGGDRQKETGNKRQKGRRRREGEGIYTSQSAALHFDVGCASPTSRGSLAAQECVGSWRGHHCHAQRVEGQGGQGLDRPRSDARCGGIVCNVGRLSPMDVVPKVEKFVFSVVSWVAAP